jgi:hypothetical protein
MVTKKKCGTSKMKRVMSGGKGKVSRYTQKFKQSYNRFIKIGDNDDDNSKLKKMEEWGRMRGIYKFLKYQNKKYTGESGDEKTALEKMEENINRTPNNEGYKSAISCFEQSENDILSGEGGQCIPEEDYIKGVGGMETTSEESSPVYGTEADADAVTEDADADAVTKDADADAVQEEEDPVTAPVYVQKENTETSSSSPATEEEAAAVNTAAVNTEASVDDAGDTTADEKEQQGGRSKRRPRSSRRGKSMKSKKARRTRRR